jgi:hypothetical protein
VKDLPLLVCQVTFIWNRERRSAPAESQHSFWSTGAIFEYLSDCAAAFGTSIQTLITSTKAMILIILSVIILAFVAALIARYPFAVAARLPSLFRSNPQPAVSQSVQVHT